MCFIILVHNGQVDLTSLSFLSSDVSGNIAEVWVVGCVLVAGSGTQHFVSWNYDMATEVLRCYGDCTGEHSVTATTSSSIAHCSCDAIISSVNAYQQHLIKPSKYFDEIFSFGKPKTNYNWMFFKNILWYPTLFGFGRRFFLHNMHGWWLLSVDYVSSCHNSRIFPVSQIDT